MGVLHVLFGLTAAAVIVLAASFVSRRSHLSRVGRPGAAVVPPVRPQATGGMAVPVITDAPDADERQAFAYSNGLTIEGTSP
jgi:hypothetical protein